MKAILKPIKDLRPNPDNPRTIREDKFQKLVASIRALPSMLDIRPIVADEDWVVLGGNMRLRACVEAGLEEVPVIQVKGWTDEQKREFIIKDNVGFGEWDWDVLANEWDSEILVEWGLDVWTGDAVDVGDLFELQDEDEPGKRTLSFKLEADTFDRALDYFDKLDGSKEDWLIETLGL